MTVKLPEIQVPITVFLDLVRSYVEQPQELINRQSYLEALRLQKRAQRKLSEYRKALRLERQG